MSNPKEIPTVFISSTIEDLREHRKAVSDAANSARLLPDATEYWPARGKRRPLEECLQRVCDADVLLVVVAHRCGWIPGDQPQGEARSITWLECLRAIEEGKEVLAFVVDEGEDWPQEFREENRIANAIRKGEATPALFEEVKAASDGLRKFKKWLNEQGIRKTFTNLEDLRGKAEAALRDWRERWEKDSSKPPKPRRKTAPKALEVQDAYKNWLLSRCTDVGLLGMRPKQVQTVRLNSVYVPAATRREGDDQIEALKKGKQRAVFEEQPAPRLLLDLLCRRSLYVSGPPGSGKSTFCRWVAWLVCAGGMPRQEVQAPQELRETWPDALQDRLPLLVPLRQLWPFLPDTAGTEQLLEGLSGWLQEIRPPGLDAHLLQAHLKKGSALIILDGVDEVPLSRSRGADLWAPRTLLLSGLAEAVPHWVAAKNRLLLTSRPYGLRASDQSRLRLQNAPIENLTQPQQNLLARRWFHIQSAPGQTPESLAQDMLSNLRNRPGLDALAENPLLLTATCIIYGEGKQLPQDKSDLYGRIVDTVLYSRFPQDRSVVDPIRNRLCVVAHGMHSGEGLGEERETPQAEATKEEIDRLIRAYQESTPYTEKGYRGAVEAREQLLSSSGLLLPSQEGKAAFYHFSLQEFLAALRLLDLHEGDLLPVFLERAGRSEWRNTLSLLFGADLASRNSPRRSVDLVSSMIDAFSKDRIGLKVVAAECLETLLGRGIGLPEESGEKFRKGCLEAIEDEVALLERNLLGLVLGKIGDPRVLADLRDPAAYVEVPAGDYSLGRGKDRRTYSVEKPFLLSRYPVTNSQFELFLDEGGYQDEQHWSKTGLRWLKKSGAQEPRLWRDAGWNAPNQPVVGVCCWEAEAFANWAGGRLPTEWEWEAAARGKDASQYPWCGQWKDGICNTRESGLGMTSAVGIFPASASPTGLQDLSGNVWEWCQPDEEEKGADKEAINARRPLRGGSWINSRDNALPTFRYRNYADNRVSNWGFRVLLCVGPRTRNG